MTPEHRSSDPVAAPRSAPDVIVVGDGIIGLACSLAIARAGGTVCLIGHQFPGSASTAAAGLLAPSLGPATADVRALWTAGRDLYPAFVRWLAERTGVEVPLSREGIVELQPTATQALPKQSGAKALDARELARVEPAIPDGIGGGASRAVVARLHELDGYVDNVSLLEAMREAVRCEWAIDVVHGRAAHIDFDTTGCSVVTEDARRHSGGAIVLAAGAWVPLVDGLPRPLRVEPVRGQIVSLRGCPLRHAVAGSDAYLVPRGECTLVGSTLERVGFDNSTTASSVTHLRAAAGALVPALKDAEVAGAWAGLRPMTPDSNPVVGRDPEHGSLLYACGHGKNGILLAPLTGECIAALAARSTPRFDIRAFAVERFA